MVMTLRKTRLQEQITYEPLVLAPSVQQYFANLKAHERLLADKIRLEAFERAINEIVCPGDVVMDIGAGTGILSQYALEAGAHSVWLVEENENILLTAKEKLTHATRAGKTIFIPKRSSELKVNELPGKCDVIISETLGSLGINEGILHTLADAKRFLKKDGRIIPRRLKLRCALYLLTDDSIKINQPSICREISYNVELVTEPITLFSFNFMQNILQEGSCKFVVPETVTDYDGICFWFQSDLSPSVYINTSPEEHETSWGSVLFPCSVCDNLRLLVEYEHHRAIGPATEICGISEDPAFNFVANGWSLIQPIDKCSKLIFSFALYINKTAESTHNRALVYPRFGFKR